MFQVNTTNTRIRCEISSKLTIKTPEKRQCILNRNINTPYIEISVKCIVCMSFMVASALLRNTLASINFVK